MRPAIEWIGRSVSEGVRGDLLCPLLHVVASAFQHVGSSVGAFGLIAHGVGEGALGEFAGMPEHQVWNEVCSP